MMGESRSLKIHVRAMTARVLVLGAAWWAASEGVIYNLPLAALVVLLAAASSIVAAPPRGAWRISMLGALAFAFYFIVRSTAAGADVARRALHPALPVRPGRISHWSRLPEGPPRALFTAVLNLLPGTLSVRRDGALLHLHVLDMQSDVARDVQELESRVAKIFGVDVAPGIDRSLGENNSHL